MIPDESTLNFQGDKATKQIKYNPVYYHDNISIFNDDVLRFTLLHEEAHIIRSKSKMSYFRYVTIFLIILVGVFFFAFPLSLILKLPTTELAISSIPLYAIVMVLGLFFCLPIVWRYSWDTMNYDEFDADDYAAGCLFKFFDIQNPAQTVLPYFKKVISEKEKQKTKKLKFKMKLVGTYPDYHPANCERLE